MQGIKIAPDKWKHIIVGGVLGIVFQLATNWLLPNHLWLDCGITLAIVIAIAYGWELLSKITGKGHYEVMDAVASAIGGLVGIAIVLLAGYLI